MAPSQTPAPLQCERLSHGWASLAGEVKDARKWADKRSAELDAARLRHLGLK